MYKTILTKLDIGGHTVIQPRSQLSYIFRLDLSVLARTVIPLLSSVSVHL